MKDIERLAGAMKYLTRGWNERVEWGPARIHSVKHEPLLAQLGYAALIKGTGEPSLGSNPNKAGSRPPGNAAPLNLLDRIAEEARASHREALELMGNDVASVVPTLHVCGVLHALMSCAVQLQHEHPRAVARTASLGDGWVSSARLLLGYDRRTVMLRDVSCDACGGALSVPVDASGDVVCVGVLAVGPEPATGACGRAYPRSTWPGLLAAREQHLWTTRDAVTYLESEHPGADARWLYNWARESKIRNYGDTKKALWDSREVLDQMSRFVAPYSCDGEAHSEMAPKST